MRALIEEGLRRALDERRTAHGFRLRNASFGEGGLSPGVREGSWEQLRDLIHEGRGA